MGFSLNPLHDLSSALHAGERLADRALHTGEKLGDDGARDFEGALKDAANVAKHISPSQIGHTALDAIGMIPVVGTVANLANAGWYAAQGDWTDAGMSALAAIPIEGDAVDALKLGKDGVEIAEDAVKAERVVKGGEDAAKAGETGAEIADRVETTARDAEAGGRSAETEARAGAKGHPDTAEDSAAETGARRPPEKPGEEPSVWVQHGHNGAVREYDPRQLEGEGPHEVDDRVTTDAGKGKVVSRGDPPNQSEVDHPKPEPPPRGGRETQVREIEQEIRNSLEDKNIHGGSRSGESPGAAVNRDVGNRMIQEANRYKEVDRKLAEMLKTRGKRLLNRGSRDPHPGRDPRRT